MAQQHFTCPRCRRHLAKGLARCPYCGVPFSGTRNLSRSASGFRGENLSKKGIRNILIFLGIAVGAALILVLQDLPQGNRRAASQDQFARLHAELTAEAEKADQAAALGELYELALTREFRGRGLRMAVPRSADDADSPYSEAIQTFSSQTGIKVFLQYYEHDVPKGGRAVDALVIRRYELLKRLAAEGELIDVRDVLGEEVLRQRYASPWLDLSTLPGKDGPIVAGVWHSYTPRVGIFYARDDFEAAGYPVPASWDDLIALADKIAARGDKPWCIGAEPLDPRGTLAAYWLQAVLLRTQPEEVMENLFAGEQDVRSPEIRRAYEQISSIWFDAQNVFEAPLASQEDQSQAMASLLVAEPPGCWMFLGVNLTDAVFPADARYGQVYDWFPMPEIEKELGQPQIFEGDVISVTNDWPATAALLDYFTRPESTKPWLDDAGSLSPHKNTSPGSYDRPFKRALAEKMEENSALAVDIFERMPAWIYDQAAAFTRTGLSAIPARRAGNIGDLAAEGSLSVTAKGVNIESLQVNIRNLAEELLTVEIPAGTYFDSADGGMQNMVIRKTVTVEIEPGEMLGKLVDASCAEMEKDIPRSETEFQIKHPGPANLRNLMEVIDQAAPGYAVTQAAVWIVTDNADYDGLGRLAGIGGFGRVISEEEAAEAMRLVDDAGLTITRFRIWADHSQIAERASPELAKWIWSRAND
jgi:alpha-glucoside transport system substrate-binding protein